MSTRSIKSWAADDRPREKLILKGKSAISNVELLAILLGSGTQDQTAVQVARTILNDFENNMDLLSKCSIHDLMKYNGVGSAKAAKIYAALEIGRRISGSVKSNIEQITSSRDAYLLMLPKMKDLTHEEFHVIYLNRRNQVILNVQVSKGGLSGTVADGKIIFRKALELRASHLILVHNHPSGNLEPSQADVKLTASLREFGNYIDLKVLDHLILTDNNYFSFADEGLIK